MRPRLRPRPTPRTLITAFAAASALALAGCSASSGSAGGTANTGYVKGVDEVNTVPLKDRGAAITISGKDLDGKQLGLADYKGKIVVLNVWGSWCPPCRAEAPDFEKVFQATRSQGVQFVGLDTRDLQVAQPKAFVADHGLTYPSLYDPDGDLLLKFPAGTLNPQTIPTTIVLDRQGRVAARALKPLLAEELTKILAPLIAEKS
jgi:peroxiredoxin